MTEANMDELYRVIVVRGTTLVGVFIVQADREAEAIAKFKAESDRSAAVCSKPYHQATDLVAASKLDVHQEVALVFSKTEYLRRSASP